MIALTETETEHVINTMNAVTQQVFADKVISDGNSNSSKTMRSTKSRKTSFSST
ncbi:hypothetical protein R75465_00336 [Paraburkholderia aspalathi]|nr:hypothetical protein R75465_00336 [Paraburkholderia aspalathi]